MKKSSALLFQIGVVLLGVAALAFLLWEPHVEGRNAHATLFQIYFNDPFLAYAYLGSIPFFVALYQVFKVLGHAGQNRISSQEAVKALRIIRYCALSLIGLVAVGEILLLMGESDDRAGGVFMGILVTFGSIVIAGAAGKLERYLLTQ